MPERDPDENGWKSSAKAWITRNKSGGDFSRVNVLDRPMMERVSIIAPLTALDIGCGDGRFCRMLADAGIKTVGIDPVSELIDAAKEQHPEGRYEIGFAEELPQNDERFDLILSYLSLIDIDDVRTAVNEMVRVLNPGGRILVANLTSFSTSSAPIGKRKDAETGELMRPLGNYLEEKPHWFEWDGLRIRNWHRPLSFYMKTFLDAELKLTYFDEPRPHSGPEDRVKAYDSMPYLMIMEWQKPQ